MKIILWLVLILHVALSGAWATTILDPYGGTNPGGLKNNGDVIGLLSKFDLDRVIFNNLGGGAFRFSIFMNYNNGDTTLSGINLGSWIPVLYPGDILLSTGSSYYAIPLISHTNSGPGSGGLSAGHLYAVNGFLTARTVLGNPSSAIYRPDHAVWGDANGALQLGTGSVTATAVGGSAIQVDVNFSTTDSSFLDDVLNGIAVMFASATCGNDVLEGRIPESATPEPVTYALIGAGLTAIGLARKFRGPSA